MALLWKEKEGVKLNPNGRKIVNFYRMVKNEGAADLIQWDGSGDLQWVTKHPEKVEKWKQRIRVKLGEDEKRR